MTNSVEPLILPRPVNMTPPQQDPAEHVDDTIDIRGLVSKLWAGKWIIAICLLIAYVIGYLSTSQIVPTYRADATVMFDIRQNNIVDLQDILGEERFDKGKLEDQMLILSSTSLIERVVDQLDLDQDPEFNPALREYEPSLLDRVKSFVSLPPGVADILRDLGLMDPPEGPVEYTEADRIAREERLRVVIVENVKDGLWLNPVGDSRVLRISFISTDPDTAADVANATANQYIVDQLEAKLEATTAATSWLSVRVDELRTRVEEAENKVEATRSELAAEQGQSLEITEQQLAALNASLVRAQSETTRLEADYNRLKNALDDPDALDTVSEFRASPVIGEIRQQETDLAAQVIALSASVSQDNPSLVLAKRQLEEVRKHIREQVLVEAGKIVAAAQNDLIASQEREATLVGQVRQLEQNAFSQAAEEVTLRQYEREAQASRVLYESLLARLQETNAQKDLQAADARILSPAEVPLYARSQQQRRTMMLTMFLGGVAGIGIVFLLNMLNNTFRSPDQLEEISGETVLGTLPSIGTRMKRQAVLENLRGKPNSSLAESVRSLRTSILFSNVDNPPKVVMFTSSVPHEGKTTSAMLVAMTSRQMGKSAIIVDCDLRLPALAHMIKDTEDRPGLLSVIDGTTPIKDAIYEEPTSGLHVLMTHTKERQGSISAADVLSSRRFEQLITDLSKTYDLVILDTPPALMVTDARIVSKLVDAVVYAVRWDKTPRGAVLSGLKEMRTVDAPIAGLVMTMINEARAAKYSYDGYNYYKGKYRDYYGS
ncbi:Tyrosine-protein kinase ptk [Roseovarius albus]|uniref:non-specific protein-tyrosine kinase n=1 Tax=Roseovarius albus TaxID=1247867 RepID=A0A1X6ZRW3_9RHOB|nr:polysaccharide biosynthesis tyrosine autokinase [Roseovarius albus]SLN59108.1 Tyrosine-protein kinase ptk [Roseovarius albus]